MPLAIRVIDKVAELSDWDQASFVNGMFVMWDATSGQYIGSYIEYTNLTPKYSYRGWSAGWHGFQCHDPDRHI